MDIKIRLEKESDYRKVEELTREAFWNLYVPGCDEHFLVHKMRKCPVFIPALDFVALTGGRIVGHIVYCQSKVINDKSEAFEVITFGPVSVLPSFQKQGIGSMLIRYSLKKAEDMGFKAVLIYGDPDYYNRFGFKGAKEFNIRTSDGRFMDALMALELKHGALKGVSGRFFEGEVYSVSKEELAQFEKTFPYKEKFVTESQKRFAEMANQSID